MNIEKLARKAINYINKNWGLPEEGFLTGGALSNLIWQEISGVEAVINDIDIFLLDSICDKRELDKRYLFTHTNIDKVPTYDDYNGLRFINVEKNFYSIISSNKDGIFNYIKYESSTENPKIIIDSFDLNCVMIGYIIEEDRFIWTKDYENFIKNNKIELANVYTPHHTAIRIVKKSNEMNIKLDPLELEILEYVIGSSAYDIKKHRFMDRYMNIFMQYEDELSMFYLKKDSIAMESLMNNHKVDANLWMLLSKVEKNMNKWGDKKSTHNTHSISCNDILFYFRKVYTKSKKLRKAWITLKDIYIFDGYINEDYNENDLKLLYNIYLTFPEAIINLRGQKFEDQIRLIKHLLNIFKDKSVVFALLNTNKVNSYLDIYNINELDTLLLELSVRKYIISEHFNSKVNDLLSRI